MTGSLLETERLSVLSFLCRQRCDALRHFDDTDATSLLAEGTGSVGLGIAIMNRLRKASGGNIIYV